MLISYVQILILQFWFSNIPIYTQLKMVLGSKGSNYEISYKLQFTFTDGCSCIRWEFSSETLIYHLQNRWETQKVGNKKPQFRTKNRKCTTQQQRSFIWTLRQTVLLPLDLRMVLLPLLPLLFVYLMFSHPWGNFYFYVHIVQFYLFGFVFIWLIHETGSPSP